MEIILGVGIAIIKDGKILLGFHKARKYENPCWAMPGGHVEINENVFDAARREAEEETGLKIGDLEPITFFDDFVDRYRVISFQVLCKEFEGDIKLAEPEKISEWKWFKKGELPDNLTQNVRRVIDSGLLNF